jgi:hypothetical protein
MRGAEVLVAHVVGKIFDASSATLFAVALIARDHL